jgi:hypothetical protein
VLKGVQGDSIFWCMLAHEALKAEYGRITLNTHAFANRRQLLELH